jgi:hypothetical protein
VEVFGDEYEEEVDTGYKPGTLDIPLTIGMIQNILHEISAKQKASWTTPHAPLLPLFSSFAYVLPFYSTISV